MPTHLGRYGEPLNRNYPGNGERNTKATAPFFLEELLHKGNNEDSLGNMANSY